MGKKYGFYDKVPNESVYHFDENNKASSVDEFLMIVKTINTETLKKSIESEDSQQLKFLQYVGKTNSFNELRKKLKSRQMRNKDLVSETLKSSFSWRWFAEVAWKRLVRADIRSILRMMVVLLLVIIGLVFCFAPAFLAAGLVFLLFLSNILLESYAQFKRLSTPERATWDGLRLAVNLMVVAQAALLAVVNVLHNSDIVNLKPWFIGSVAAGLFFGLWGVLNSVEVRKESQGQVTISALQWDVVVTLAFFQMACLLFGISVVLLAFLG